MHNTDDADTDSLMNTDKDNDQTRPILVRSNYRYDDDEYDKAHKIFAKQNWDPCEFEDIFKPQQTHNQKQNIIKRNSKVNNINSRTKNYTSHEN